MTDYAIVGNGAAGMSAALEVLARDKGARLTIISDEPHRPYLRPELAQFIMGKRDEASLAEAAWDLSGRDGVEMLSGARVSGLEPAAHRLRLEDGRTIAYDKLLLAPGGEADVPEHLEKCRGDFSVLITLDDAKRLAERIRGAKRAVVQGGGLLGQEMVRILRFSGLEVTYLLAESSVYHESIFEGPGDEVWQLLRQRGVEFGREGEAIGEIRKDGERVVGVRTSARRTVACDLVAVALGVRPRTAFLRGSGIEVQKGIVVDGHLQTSVAEVYAAGDAAQAWSSHFKRHLLTFGWPNAIKQGRLAGANMTGASEEFDLRDGTDASQIYGLSVISRWD